MYCHNSAMADKYAYEEGLAQEREISLENKIGEITDKLIDNQDEIIEVLHRLTDAPVSIEMLHKFFYSIADNAAQHQYSELKKQQNEY